MKTWTMWLSGTFSAGILILAAAAAWRATPVAVVDAADDSAWRDGGLTREFEKRYDAAFPARTLGVNTWAAIAYLMFREGQPGVVVGRDGWLFTAEEFGSVAGTEPQVEAHLDLVSHAQGRLAGRGTALIVALVPAKARVYPESLPARHSRGLRQALYESTRQGLRSRGIAAPDLPAALIACKARQVPKQAMFLRTDTHWTPAGASCTARRLAAEAQARGLRTPAPAQYRTSVTSEERHRGDLLAFLPLDPWFAGLLPPDDDLELQRTEPMETGGTGLLDEAPRPEVVLVGTSYSANPRWNFTGALRESFGEEIVSYADPARGPFRPMLDYLDSADFRSAPPRLVIWEMPERYFPMPDPQSDSA